MKSLAWMFVAVALLALGASALAAPPQLRPVVPPTQTASLHATPTMVPHPIATLLLQGRYVGKVAPGSVVPLTHLPRLPFRSSFNTMTPKMAKGRLHPMAANGAYIDITSTSCSGAYGDDFPVGCALTWKFGGLSNGDTKQDYYIVSTNKNETAATAATSFTTTPPTETTTLSTAGTYIFGTYDVTTSQWIAVIYVNAGEVFSVQVYSDPFHTQQQYQYNAVNGTDAYIYLQNVAASDYYVVAVSQTGVSPNCVFIAPAPTGYTYASNKLCNMTGSSGVQAPGGNLSVSWPLTSSLVAGSYNVEVYDLTAGERLGQVQVGITGSGGTVLTTYPDGTGPDINPSPAALAAPTPDTVLAWDGGSVPGPQDESVSGIKTSVTGTASGSSYLWTLLDPEGQVVASKSFTATGTTSTNVFNFDALSGGVNRAYLLPPGKYPAKSYLAQLYDAGSKSVLASQAFQMLGYSTETQFNTGSVSTPALANSLNITPSVIIFGFTFLNANTAGLRFTNTGDTTFDNQGDNLSQIEFSTGSNFNATDTGGNGIFLSTSTNSLCNLVCTTTGTDSNGNVWNATITCSDNTLTANGQCNMMLVPQSSSVTLAPGAYVEVDNLNFFGYSTFGSSACSGSGFFGGSANACPGITSELPQHGLTWSCVPGVLTCPTTSSIAMTAVFFDNTSFFSTVAGTAQMQFYGSCVECAGSTSGNTSATAPIVGNHWFKDYFLHADYNLDSPYQAASGKSYATGASDILQFTFNNTSSAGFGGGTSMVGVAISFPSTLASQAFFGVPNTWVQTTCSGLPSNTECFNFGATGTGSIAAGSSGTYNLYVSAPQQSIAFSDLAIYGNFGTTTTPQYVQLSAVAGTNTTPDQLYSLDDLSMGYYSLIGSDMSASFNPNSVGQGATASLGFTYTNTSTAVDANPDSVDALVLEAPSNALTLNTGSIAFSQAGWSYLGKITLTGSSYTQYWFGMCASQFTSGAKQGQGNYGGPDQAENAWPLTSGYGLAYPSLGQCSGGVETNALHPAGSLSVSGLKFSGFGTTGSQQWHMYAHGADAGGWSSAQTLNLNVTAESASVWFNKIGTTTYSSPTIPTIGASPNTYQYAVENTSNTSNIGLFNVTLPGTDVNGQNAYDGTNYWNIPSITSGGVTITYPTGQTGVTCSVVAANTYNATSAGVNGQIQVSCTGFAPGKTVYVNMNNVVNPSSENDSYLFPTTLEAAGYAAGASWLGSDEVTESFSLGLDIVVDPSNPGPANSTPTVNCQNTCAFSGTNINFGSIADSASDTFQDVLRTTVVYSGATSAGHNFDLYVEASSNPTNTSGSPANELLTKADNVNSASKAGTISYIASTGSYTVVPTTSPGLELVTVPEAPGDTDVLNDFEVSMGPTDPITSETITLTYTVIPN